MPTLTGRTQISAEMSNVYSRELIETSYPAYKYNMFAVVRDIPQNAGTNVIKFRQYSALSANVTPLSPGVTPNGTSLSATDITATVLRYGDYVILDDEVLTESIDPILMEAARELGEQAGLSLDTICRDIVTAGTNVQYAGVATATNEVTSAMKLNRMEVKVAVRTLKGANAKPITKMIDASTGQATVPIGRSFMAICSEDTTFDLDDAAGFIPVEKYPNKSNVMEDEVGAMAGVRFIETTNAKVKAASGADGNDVHCTIVFAKNAYAQSRISGLALQNIVKPIGSGGSEDPLDQRGTSGWKASYVARILDQTKLVRIEHGVSDS